MADPRPDSSSSGMPSETVPVNDGSDPRTADFAFGAAALPRCPYCHQTLQKPASDVDEVVCPECGSVFRLEGGDSATTVDYRQPMDEFVLVANLGRGATGTVWKAWDTKLHHLVAIKIPHQSLLAASGFAERLMVEARSVARLEHPGIVRFYEFREISDVPVLITGFIDGIALLKLLEARRLPFRTSAEIVAAVAEALEYAHSMGCIHRDIKPANIMIAQVKSASEAERPKHGESTSQAFFQLTATGGEKCLFRPVVVDFGLALRSDVDHVLTVQGQLLGTIAYMSPEQASGNAHLADARTDVYCLGVVLYEMLTAELPFRGSTAMMLHQIQHDEPRRPRQTNDKISRDLETICLKALNKEPNKRYQTAGAMADDLRRYLADMPIKARPAGRVERGSRWCKRNPRLAAMSGLAAASMIFAFVMLGIWNLQKSAALYASRHNESLLALDRALGHLDKDEGNLGLLWLGRALQLAPPNAVDLQHVIRSNLSTWMARAAIPRAIVSHGGKQVTATELSPNGRTAASGCYRKALLWDVETGRMRGPPLAHEGHVLRTRFSPDGEILVTTSGDQQNGSGEVKFWDAETGAELGALPKFAAEVKEAHFSRDGLRLLTISGGEARVWNVATRTPLTKPLVHGQTVFDGAFSPDGKWILTCSADDREIWLWETAAESMKKSWPHPHGGGATVVAFSPDGRFFVSGHLDGKVCIRRVDVSDSNEITFKHQGRVLAVSFSPDGRKVLTAGEDSTARLWSASTGEPLTPPLTQSDLQAAAFSGDGRYVVTAGRDKTARVWETATGRAVCLPLEHQASVLTVALSHDGSTVLTGSHDFKARTWRLPHAPPSRLRVDMDRHSEVRMATFHPDGQSLIAVGQQAGHPGHLQFFDSRTGSPLGTDLELGSETPVECAVDKDGRFLAIATENGSVQVWDLKIGRKVETRLSSMSSINAASFQANGRGLLTGEGDGNVQSWEIPTWRPLGEPLSHDAEVKALAVSSDGTRVLVGYGDRSALLWNLAGRQELKRFLHQDPVSVVAFSPDGRFVATGGIGKTIRISNASGNFDQRFSLAHPHAVVKAAFSHEGELLATGCADGAIRLWDVVSGKQIGPPLFHDLSHFSDSDIWLAGRTRSLEFSSDNTSILTAGADQSLRIWPVPQPRAGGIDEIIRHIEVLTVMELDPAGAPGDLDLSSWLRRIQSSNINGSFPVTSP